MRNLECEKRVILTFEQYQRVLAAYMALDPNFKILEIENTYLDDENLSLRKIHHVLRIRKTNGKNEELTLKYHGDNGDVEINETVSSHPEIDKALNYEFNNYHPIAKLKTNRIEVKIDDYLVVIDQNFYNGIIDYDLEVEASSIEKAEQIIKNICDRFSIEYKNDYAGKASRAIGTRKI